MKGTRGFAIVMLLSLLALARPILGAPIDEGAARTVVQRYFAALSQGDVYTIRSLLGGDLLEKRRRLLDNPTYPSFLIKTYQQAHFEIRDAAVVDGDKVAVDTVIAVSPEEIVNRRYLIAAQRGSNSAEAKLVIYNEVELNE